MSERLDIIIFGATGFTGRRVVPRLHDILKAEGLPLTWGIAGRSESKLKEIIHEAERKTGDDLSHVPIIVADVADRKSLTRMTEQTKVLINTIGPFRFYGEQVVQACLDTSTHHLDVSGEPQYMEEIQLRYHEKALKRGVYLISACGVDSIPADLGVIYLQNNFDGTVNSVESYHYGSEDGGPYPGPELNYATWVSAVHGITNAKDLAEVRKQLFAERLPKCEPKIKNRGKLHKNSEMNRWFLPFPGADRAVLMRTQRSLYELYKERPAQIQCYFGFEYLSTVASIACLGPVFLLFCKFDATRELLLKYPSLFSGGTFTHGGPSEEKMENSNYYVVLYGEGWPEKPKDPTQNFDTVPNKKLTVKVSGKNPGYGATCTTVSLAAIMLLTEEEKMPNGGGCYPPGAAFAKTSLIEKLHKHDITFELVSKL